MINAALALPDLHAGVLSFLVKRVPPADLPWALTGSAGLRLQGVNTPVHDLDLQTDAKTVLLLEQQLAEFIKVPVHLWESEHTRSYHGQAEIDGLQVELLGGVQHRLPGLGWGAPVEIERVLQWVKWQGTAIPVLSLEYEALAYERMGRYQKAGLIRFTIRKETR